MSIPHGRRNPGLAASKLACAAAVWGFTQPLPTGTGCGPGSTVPRTCCRWAIRNAPGLFEVAAPTNLSSGARPGVASPTSSHESIQTAPKANSFDGGWAILTSRDTDGALLEGSCLMRPSRSVHRLLPPGESGREGETPACTPRRTAKVDSRWQGLTG